MVLLYNLFDLLCDWKFVFLIDIVSSSASSASKDSGEIISMSKAWSMVPISFSGLVEPMILLHNQRWLFRIPARRDIEEITSLRKVEIMD